MNVADGSSARLTHYSELEIGVMGIWRKVEIFVRPFSSENKEEVHILLGLPWLHEIDAKIRIRDSIIRIGDKEKGETLTKIKGQIFVESEEHKLVLCKNTKVADDALHDFDSSGEDVEDVEDLEDSEDSDSEGSESSENDGFDTLRI